LAEHWSPKPGVGSSSLSTRARKAKALEKIITYIKESYNELMHKVTWPTFSELQSSTVLVSVASVIIALLVLLMDVSIGITGDAPNPDGTGGSAWRGVLGFFYDFFK
jgi:preprotein translocase subunit SecE